MLDVAQAHQDVRPGSLFVARKGARADAHDHLAQSVERGAVAVVGEADFPATLPWGDVPYVRVPDARRALPQLAAVFHGHPSERLQVVGVTGTDGKTTTSFLLHHLLGARYPSGLLSTAGVRIGAERTRLSGHFTTPEAPEIQALLRRGLDAGLSHVVLEASSHGFSLHRLDAIRFRLGVWTNLSPEHLDHHGSLEAYREAKLTLVRRAPLAILNRDEPDFERFAAASNDVVTYGEHPEAELRIIGVNVEAGALSIDLEADGERQRARLPMIGRFNAWNAAAALAAARALGLSLAQGVARLASFEGVPGRMQVVQAEPFLVVVDFAHTPPALEKALRAARPAGGGRLIVVVGAAGERDPGKRAPIGATAVMGADLSIFTEEDSRGEDAGSILASIGSGALEATRAADAAGAARSARGPRSGRGPGSFRVVPDRAEAIRQAIAEALPGDVVLLAGKGHERTLERADETLSWDEAAEARRWL